MPLKTSSASATAGEMLLPLELLAAATWVVSSREIFYCDLAEGKAAGLWAFNLETRRKRQVHSTDAPLARGLALSSSGDSLLFVRTDRLESNIMVANYTVVK